MERENNWYPMVGRGKILEEIMVEDFPNSIGNTNLSAKETQQKHNKHRTTPKTL